MPQRPSMPLMIEALTIELIDLLETLPSTLEERQNAIMLQASLDFAWGRAGRPWGPALAEALAASLPDVFATALQETGADAERLALYATTARLLLELEEGVREVAVDLG